MIPLVEQVLELKVIKVHALLGSRNLLPGTAKHNGAKTHYKKVSFMWGIGKRVAVLKRDGGVQ